MPRDALLLEEMIEAAAQAVSLVRDVTAAEVAADRMRRDALLRNFAVLGEAATQLSTELQDRFPEVPWRQPARLRNRIIHGTAEQQLPSFLQDLRRVLAAVTSDDGSDPGT